MYKGSAHIVLGFLFVLITSCRKDIGSVAYGDYPAGIGKIIKTNCAVSGCHNAASYQAAGNYNLETWKSMFAGASSGSPVIPYNSRFSSLCYFINTYPDLGTQNLPTMPLNGSKLSYAEVKSIKEWIDSGAPDISGNVMWADNPDRKKFYAVNQGCDLITVFDGNSQLPMRCVEVGNKPEGDAPHQLRVSPDGKYWYVLFINNNILQKFRCSDDSYVGSIPLTPLAAGTGTENNLDWNTFVISSDGKRAYCASWTRNGRVSAVDLENARLLHYSPVLFEPHGIALNATEDKLYVAAQTGNFITELDTAFTSATPFYLDNTSSPNTESSVDPHDLILSPDGNAMLITCQKTNDVRVFDMTLKKVTQIVPTGVYPQEIIYSSASKAYFVSCTEDNVSFPGKTGVLTRIDAQNYATQKLQCGHQPHGIAVDEGKKILYVLSRNVSASGPAPHHTSQCAGKNGFINFVDLNTFSLLPGRYELSVDPYFIAARP